MSHAIPVFSRSFLASLRRPVNSTAIYSRCSRHGIFRPSHTNYFSSIYFYSTAGDDLERRFQTMLKVHAYQDILDALSDNPTEKVPVLENAFSRVLDEEDSMSHLRHHQFPHFVRSLRDQAPVFMYLYAKMAQKSRNHTEYVKYLQKASEKGHLLGMMEYAEYLDRMHRSLSQHASAADNGTQTKIDHIRTNALHLLLRCAQFDESHAHFLLADYYKNAWGTEADVDKCLHHRQLAHQLGHHLALFQYASDLLNEKQDVVNALQIMVDLADNDASGKYDFLLSTLLRESEILRSIALNATEQSMSYLNKAHDKGFPEATFTIATLLHDHSRSIVDIDFHQVLQYYEIAAARGHTQAHYIVALLNRNGVGSIIPVNPSRSFEFMSKAASNGHRVAQTWVAQFYHEGFGVAADKEKAEKLAHQLTRSGTPRAFYVVYLILKVTANLSDAVPFLKLGVDAHDPESEFAMAVHMLNEKEAKILESAGVECDMHHAMELIERSSEGKFPPALNEHGKLVVQANDARAYALFGAAANQGFVPAIGNMGHIQHHHWGNLPEAQRLYELSIQYGDQVNAKYNLARLMLDYAVRDEHKHARESCAQRAIVLLRETCAEGYPHALVTLGVLTIDPDMRKRCCLNADPSFPPDAHQAYALFERALTRVSNQNIPEIPEASLNLGLCLYFGIGVERNVTRGEQLIRKAADVGIPLAQAYLGWKYRTEHDTAASEYWFDLVRETKTATDIDGIIDQFTMQDCPIHFSLPKES